MTPRGFFSLAAHIPISISCRIRPSYSPSAFTIATYKNMRTRLFAGLAGVCIFVVLLPVNGFQTRSSSATPNRAGASASSETRTDAEMAERVRQEFRHAWTGYRQYAWGHDALKPLSKSYHDWYGVSLLMSPVDALDTMILMGLNDEATSTREYIVKNLSFDHDIYVKN